MIDSATCDMEVKASDRCDHQGHHFYITPARLAVRVAV